MTGTGRLESWRPMVSRGKAFDESISHECLFCAQSGTAAMLRERLLGRRDGQSTPTPTPVSCIEVACSRAASQRYSDGTVIESSGAGSARGDWPLWAPMCHRSMSAGRHLHIWCELTIFVSGPELSDPQLKESIVDTETASPVKVPGNKGKIVGQKAPLKLKDISGPSAYGFSWATGPGNLRSLISGWKASSGHVTWFGYVCAISAMATASSPVRLSCSNSNSRLQAECLVFSENRLSETHRDNLSSRGKKSSVEKRCSISQQNKETRKPLSLHDYAKCLIRRDPVFLHHLRPNINLFVKKNPSRFGRATDDLDALRTELLVVSGFVGALFTSRLPTRTRRSRQNTLTLQRQQFLHQPQQGHMLDATSHRKFCIGAADHNAARSSHVIAGNMKPSRDRRRAGAFDFYGPDRAAGQF